MVSPKEEGRHRLARDMLLTAEEFRRAGIVLEGDRTKGAPDVHVSIPMIVCFAFSSEMYLKFLICARTTREIPGIHSLKDLFNNHVPKDVRPIIKRHWENPPAVDLQLRTAVNQHLKRKLLTFEEALAESAKAFVEWRYHYESKGIITMDGSLNSAFRAAVFELYPTEFADVRLPLPRGALPADMQNVVNVAVRNPANDPNNP